MVVSSFAMWSSPQLPDNFSSSLLSVLHPRPHHQQPGSLEDDSLVLNTYLGWVFLLLPALFIPRHWIESPQSTVLVNCAG